MGELVFAPTVYNSKNNLNMFVRLRIANNQFHQIIHIVLIVIRLNSLLKNANQIIVNNKYI